MTHGYPRRLPQRLTERQYQKLKKHIPDRLQQRVFEVLIEGLIDAFEGPAGEFVVSAILNEELSVTDILERGKRIKDA